ncbi:MAG: energy transducer TonB [Xanthobacteraceae bacterium]|nr:energy transducer TonB [Xanthobacteraceae bacterium]
MSALTLSWFEDQSPRDIARWTAAAAIVVAIHAAAIAYFLSWQQQADIGGDAEIVTVELAPIDTTPDAVARNVAPAPETMIESKTVPTPQQQKPTQEVKIEQPPDASPSIIPEPIAKPPQKTQEVQPPAPRTAEQVKGGAPSIDPSWRTSLVRQLQRYKRYPPAALTRSEQGIVLLSFSLDRGGHVLAHRIAKSSGYAELDDEAMKMIVRAEPLPPFPASMPQTRLELTVPIRFSLQ